MRQTLSTRSFGIVPILFILLLSSANALSQQWTFAAGFGTNTTVAEATQAICTDASGNVYATGKFNTSINFGGSSSPLTANAAGTKTDGFVAKFDPSGVCQWAIRFGGAAADGGGFGIATDGASIYVTGQSQFPSTVGATAVATVGGSTDGIVFSLSASTGATNWAKAFGGIGTTDRGQAACLDPSGNLYISGVFNTRTSNPTASFGAVGSFPRTVQGNMSQATTDLFVAQINPSTGVFNWVSTGGAASQETPLIIANDNLTGSGIAYVPSLNEVVVTGSFSNANASYFSNGSALPAFSLANAGGADICVLEVDASGNFLSGEAAGGATNDEGLSITYDAATSAAYLCGYFNSAAVAGSFTLTNSAGGFDEIYYAKYDPATNTFPWARNASGSAAGADAAFGIKANGSGGVYVTGRYQGTISFPTSSSPLTSNSGGADDVFLTRVDAATGDALLLAKASGTNGDASFCTATASDGRIWIGGSFATGTFTFTPSSPTVSITSSGDDDIYIALFNDPPTINAPTVTQPTCTTPTGTIVVNATGNGTLEYSLNAGPYQLSNTFSGLTPGNYNITVRYQSNPGNSSAYSGNPVVITAPVTPVVNAPTVTQPTCATPTGTIVVNATGSGTLEYSIDGGANWFLSNTFAGLAPGNYNIAVRFQSDPACVTNYSGNPVVLNAATGCCVHTTVTFNPTGPFCINAPATDLSGLVSPSGGTFSGPGISGNTFDPSVAGAGSHTIKYKYCSAPNCCDSASQTIIVNPLPVVTCPSNSSVCINAPAFTLTGGSPAGGTYSGTGVSGGMFNPATAGTGTHTITYTYTDGNGCTNSCSFTITVNPLPTVTCPANSSVCINAPAFTLTGGSPAGGTYSGTGVSGGTFNPATAGAGTHTITYSYTDGNGCTNSCSFTITVNPLPTVTCPANSSVCINTPAFTLTGGSPAGGTYSGTGVSGGSFNPATAGAGTHTITYSYTDGNGCTNSCSFTITVNPLPTVTCPANSSVCINTPAFTLTGGSPAGGTYSGTGVSGGTFNPATAGVGTHTITYTYTNGNGCTNSCSFTITVNPLPTVTCPANSSVCLNTPAFTLTGGNPAGGTYSGTGVSGGMFNPATAGAGIRTITYSYTNANGCTNSCTFTITVNPLPVVTCPSNLSVCTNAASFTLTGGSPAGGTYSGTGVSAGKFYPAVAGPGTHTITYSYTNANGCTKTCQFTITVGDNQPPVIHTITTPISMWPPNHSYQTINVTQGVTSVTDNCGTVSVSAVVITKVTSDEVENAPGDADGNTINDIVIAANCKSVQLRKERNENSNGRVYTIHVAVTDANGNTGTATFKVVVPLNQSGAQAIDNGPAYTVNSNCNICSRIVPLITSAGPKIDVLSWAQKTDESSAKPKIDESPSMQAYPNPFSTQTTIRYLLPVNAPVYLAVYNHLGEKAALLANGRMTAGYHEVKFDASGMAAGIYLYYLRTTGKDGNPVILNGKMVVSK